MTASSGFVAMLQELLAPVGSVSIKRMFGGAGVYADGLMFAILDDDTLYFKTDETGSAAFAAEGMGPFTFATKTGEGALKSYWRVPERLLDEPDELVEWARRALGVARTGPPKRPKTVRPVAAAKKSDRSQARPGSPRVASTRKRPAK